MIAVGAVIGVTLSIRLRPSPDVKTPAVNVTGKPTATGSAQPTASSSSEPPVISIDALPIAQQKLGPIAKGSGRLVIAAAPGWCAITVDKTAKGPTPLPALDLPVGPHQLKCEPPNGRPTKTATVTLAEGQTSKFTFNLDE